MKAALTFVLSLSAADAFSTAFVARRAPFLHTHFSTSETGNDISSNSDAQPVLKTDFDSFDYNSQWYPVIWAADIPLNEPIRVTLFDVHYVVWKTLAAESGRDVSTV
jgi:hypothetical protein